MVKPKKRNKYRKKNIEKITKKEFLLTPQDKITYIYKIEKREYIEVTNVSHEIKVENEWMTIVRFDSSHGYLHRHLRVSLDNKDESIGGKIEQGSHHDWLTIAIADIRTNFIEYRRQFFERSDIVDMNS